MFGFTVNTYAQEEMPIVNVPDSVPTPEAVLSGLKGLSLDDAISKIASSAVDFIFKVLIAVLVFYVGKFIITRLYKLVRAIMERRNVDASLETFVLSVIKITLYFILIVTVIGILGVETSSFLAIFASAGVAIGMALSGTLQNFAGGVLILLLKPYKVGDYIEAQGYAGTVKAIQIFHTVINTVDNKAIIIPNGGLSTGSVNNYSLENYRRVDWSIGLTYSTDFDKAKEAMLSMLKEDSRVMTDDAHAPFVGLSELADSSINITVRAWAKAEDYWDLYFDMNRRFYVELPQKGFEFPFPQLDVHLNP
jgi:small conductance mechanosensitive channel